MSRRPRPAKPVVDADDLDTIKKDTVKMSSGASVSSLKNLLEDMDAPTLPKSPGPVHVEVSQPSDAPPSKSGRRRREKETVDVGDNRDANVETKEKKGSGSGSDSPTKTGFFTSFENIMGGGRRASKPKLDLLEQERKNIEPLHENENEPESSKTVGWSEEPKKARRLSREQAHDEKRTVVGKQSDEVMVIIPDLAQAEEEDMQISVAAAPNVRVNTIKTIGELENDLHDSNAMLNQLQPLVGGIDVSFLINKALCPAAHLEEPDVAWDWDIVFTQLSTELQEEVKSIA